MNITTLLQRRTAQAIETLSCLNKAISHLPREEKEYTWELIAKSD